ncbi:TlpA family protein disulfide reductase [Lysobacter aestuarii]|uniref:TlpA family protein disulfide reductase n=2 Tax=Marilutibacter aestuarii TaxID=1706195 RepID=A0A508ALF9_9GAMM|nr:TlpA family protein disulfide reductase [Lysobacter aestuarii]
MSLLFLAACEREAQVPAKGGEDAAGDSDANAVADADADADADAPAGADPGTPGSPARPRLVVTTVDGKAYDLAEHRGKWVVVNFWATWCKPCLKEMPELSALDAMREHIEVIGLAYEEIETAEMRAFLEKHPVVYPIAILDTYAPPADFETPRGLPMTYLIDPSGTVADRFAGPVTAHEIEAAIDEAGKDGDGAGT